MASFDRILDPDVECAPREVLRWTQSRRLVKLVETAYASVPFYRRKFDEAGVVPTDIRSIGDIAKLPLLDENELAGGYPFGMMASSRSEAAVIERKLTGSGRPYITALSSQDLDDRIRGMARAIRSMGAKPGSCILLAADERHFTGSGIIAGGAALAGVPVVPLSSSELSRVPDILRELSADMLCCGIGTARMIGDLLAERGIDPMSLRLGSVLLFGGDWTESDRASVEHRLGVKVYDVYGLDKLFGIGIAAECIMQDGLHIAEDLFYPEVIDPVTLKPLPEGQYGELVLTFLRGTTLPMIRLRTHDTVRLSRFACACGRTTVRMSRPADAADECQPARETEDASLGSGYKAAALLESIFAGFEDSDFSDGDDSGGE